MTASTMLQLKISRTKKRLSNNIWHLPIIMIAALAIMTFLSTVLRGMSLPGKYGIVEAEIPVLSASKADPGLAALGEATKDEIGAQTTVIILTPERFYFGPLQGFGEGLSDVAAKFYIPHVEGAPNLPKLVGDLRKWRSGLQPSPGATAIFIPSEEVPMPIVIQCMDALKESGLFASIVLGGGLL